MRLLVLGGSVFLGRHIVAAALEAGDDVTTFNRGQTNPGLWGSRVTQLTGDRDGGLGPLEGGEWDAVIDCSGYIPRIVRQSAEVLAGRVARYVFISTISVYDAFEPGLDESAPVGVLADPWVEEVTNDAYGPLKALCEADVSAAHPSGAIIIRPGLIVGPDDPTDRFTYWPARVARGGEVLAPESPDFRVQVIDVRDLAEWSLRMAAGGPPGLYNATGPAAALTLGEVLEASREVSGSDATFMWVTPEFIAEQGVTPWAELPLWLPAERAALHQVDVSRAVAAGLTFRPLSETIAATLAYQASWPADRKWKAGLSPSREAELLAVWNRR